MKKEEKLQLLKNFVSMYDVGSQEELTQLFHDNGVNLTQATVSRYAKELNLVKVITEEGIFKYVLPTEGLRDNILSRSLLEVKQLESLVCLEVVPGASMSVKNQVNENFGEALFAALSDDTTVLLICRTVSEAEKLADALKGYDVTGNFN